MQDSEKKYSKGHYFLALEVHLFLDAWVVVSFQWCCGGRPAAGAWPHCAPAPGRWSASAGAACTAAQRVVPPTSAACSRLACWPASAVWISLRFFPFFLHVTNKLVVAIFFGIFFGYIGETN
jgi:hypothetical protein